MQWVTLWVIGTLLQCLTSLGRTITCPDARWYYDETTSVCEECQLCFKDSEWLSDGAVLVKECKTDNPVPEYKKDGVNIFRWCAQESTRVSELFTTTKSPHSSPNRSIPDTVSIAVLVPVVAIGLGIALSLLYRCKRSPRPSSSSPGWVTSNGGNSPLLKPHVISDETPSSASTLQPVISLPHGHEVAEGSPLTLSTTNPYPDKTVTWENVTKGTLHFGKTFQISKAELWNAGKYIIHFGTQHYEPDPPIIVRVLREGVEQADGLDGSSTNASGVRRLRDIENGNAADNISEYSISNFRASEHTDLEAETSEDTDLLGHATEYDLRARATEHTDLEGDTSEDTDLRIRHATEHDLQARATEHTDLESNTSEGTDLLGHATEHDLGGHASEHTDLQAHGSEHASLSAYASENTNISAHASEHTDLPNNASEHTTSPNNNSEQSNFLTHATEPNELQPASARGYNNLQAGATESNGRDSDVRRPINIHNLALVGLPPSQLAEGPTSLISQPRSCDALSRIAPTNAAYNAQLVQVVDQFMAAPLSPSACTLRLERLAAMSDVVLQIAIQLDHTSILRLFGSMRGGLTVDELNYVWYRTRGSGNTVYGLFRYILENKPGANRLTAVDLANFLALRWVGADKVIRLLYRVHPECSSCKMLYERHCQDLSNHQEDPLGNQYHITGAFVDCSQMVSQLARREPISEAFRQDTGVYFLPNDLWWRIGAELGGMPVELLEYLRNHYKCPNASEDNCWLQMLDRLVTLYPEMKVATLVHWCLDHGEQSAARVLLTYHRDCNACREFTAELSR